MQKRNLYIVLIEAFEEFRYNNYSNIITSYRLIIAEKYEFCRFFHQRLRNLHGIAEVEDDWSVCPACPKVAIFFLVQSICVAFLSQLNWEQHIFPLTDCLGCVEKSQLGPVSDPLCGVGATFLNKMPLIPTSITTQVVKGLHRYKYIVCCFMYMYCCVYMCVCVCNEL